jgi:WD40 repeat protein
VLNIVFSASMDTTVRLWRLPSRDHDPYAPYDPSTAIQTLEGHTDVVWDICLLPSRPERNGGAGTNPNKRLGAESQLISASADGTAKVWEDGGGRWNLVSTFSDFGPDVIPTCLSVDNHDFGRVIIGLSNGLVKTYIVSTGREVQSFGEVGSQVNAVISHPTLPLIVTGHEDGYLKFYDTKSCECAGRSRSQRVRILTDKPLLPLVSWPTQHPLPPSPFPRCPPCASSAQVSIAPCACGTCSARRRYRIFRATVSVLMRA